MPKMRVAIKKQDREKILAEFNHRCAICGADRPQVHHIDENPSNNESDNLLPLCPTCHLVDQHNPTAPVDPTKLRLFRRYKDPVILGPQFHPLFRRLLYLLEVENSTDADSLVLSSKELVAFVSALKMGQFYHVRIAELIVHESSYSGFNSDTDDVIRQREEKRRRALVTQLLANRDKAVDLVIEMLRYQDWASSARG